jgi:hypothetical protein
MRTTQGALHLAHARNDLSREQLLALEDKLQPLLAVRTRHVPSMDAMMEWSMDSSIPTPDGDTLEPDADGSWLRLLGVI